MTLTPEGTPSVVSRDIFVLKVVYTPFNTPEMPIGQVGSVPEAPEAPDEPVEPEEGGGGAIGMEVFIQETRKIVETSAKRNRCFMRSGFGVLI